MIRIKSRHISVSLLVVVVLIFLWKFLFKDFSRLMPRYLDSYKQHADKLIKDGKLYYDNSQEIIKYQGEDKLETSYTSRRAKPSAFQENYKDEAYRDYYYYRKSMLRRDVEDFKKARDSSSRAKYFRFKEEVKSKVTERGKRYIRQLKLSGINPYSHKRSSPTLKSRRWEGKLYFRESEQGISLVAGDHILTILRSDPRWVSPARGFQHDLHSGRSRRYNPNTRRWEIPQNGSCSGKLLEIVYIDSGQRKAQVVYQGDHALIKQKDNDPYFRIYINQSSEGKISRLEPETDHPLKVGDIVTFERIHRKTGNVIFKKDFFVSERTDPSLVSFYKHVPDYRQGIMIKQRQLNIRDFSFAEEVCRSMDMVMSRMMKGEEDFRNTFDLYMTIDRDLQQAVTHLLHNFIKQRWRGQNIRGGITVMDASTGDVLAIASHPGESYDKKQKATLKSPQRKYRFNQNLKTHGIGSIAKLLVAAAIYNRAPDLINLQVPCRRFPRNSTSQRILGVDFVREERINLPPRGPCTGGDGRLNVDDLLKFSPNQYIVELGLLSLAICTPEQLNILRNDSDTSREFKWLNKVKVGDNMHLLVHNTSNSLMPEERLYNVGRISTLDRMPYFKYYVRLGDRITYYLKDYWVVNEFQTLFNLKAILDEKQEHQLYETQVFNSFLEALCEEFNCSGQDSEALRAELSWLLSSISPETAVMSINTYTNLRREFISFLLGGATNRWSNTKLCEAMSRLVTGREIKTNLFHKIRFYDEDGRSRELLLNNTKEDRLPVDLKAHNTLLSAMRKTIESKGTAHAPIKINRKNHTLKSKLDFYNNGTDTYRLYSKTGTFTRRVRRRNIESANYLFTIARTNGGKFADGLTVAIFLKDVGASKIAVKLATLLTDHLFKYQGWRKL